MKPPMDEPPQEAWEGNRLSLHKWSVPGNGRKCRMHIVQVPENKRNLYKIYGFYASIKAKELKVLTKNHKISNEASERRL